MNEYVANRKEVVLVDLLDRILYKGVILVGDITISVAGVALVYLGLKVLLSSIDKADEMRALAGRDLLAIARPVAAGKEIME